MSIERAVAITEARENLLHAVFVWASTQHGWPSEGSDEQVEVAFDTAAAEAFDEACRSYDETIDERDRR